MPKLTPTQLQSQNKKLKQENQQLRAFLHDVINLAYQAVNKEENLEKEREKEAEYRQACREASNDKERDHLIREWDNMAIIPKDKEVKKC